MAKVLISFNESLSIFLSVLKSLKLQAPITCSKKDKDHSLDDESFELLLREFITLGNKLWHKIRVYFFLSKCNNFNEPKYNIKKFSRLLVLDQQSHSVNFKIVQPKGMKENE